MIPQIIRYRLKIVGHDWQWGRKSSKIVGRHLWTLPKLDETLAKKVKFFIPTLSFVPWPLCYAERFSSSVEYKDDGEKWICCPEEQPFDEIR